MSLLDKITGLAIKAKDNVVSKTFISKDRRLEQSLSESIKVNDIYFEKVGSIVHNYTCHSHQNIDVNLWIAFRH